MDAEWWPDREGRRRIQDKARPELSETVLVKMINVSFRHFSSWPMLGQLDKTEEKPATTWRHIPRFDTKHHRVGEKESIRPTVQRIGLARCSFFQSILNGGWSDSSKHLDGVLSISTWIG